ncbi:MAG: SMI1/KNR4 family protein [Butyrivibrio sp.]|nr:SMI1/KNR4 family protein [Muribaculum sp.]MCM1552072.1 SMI1/KNR4 family protein [Butyrivibrio sp.]
MSVYKSSDYEKVIKRIQKKIKALHIEMGECLSEETIAEFENCHKLQLPQAYRMFLKEVGDGCENMLEGCRLNSLKNSPCENLSEPFMLESFWLWEDDDRASDIIAAEQKNKVYRGNIELINLGCGMSYRLIITGKCRGEVYSFTDVGVQPCCERQDFLGWFELWIDNLDKTDYFKDFVYNEADYK